MSLWKWFTRGLKYGLLGSPDGRRSKRRKPSGRRSRRPRVKGQSKAAKAPKAKAKQIDSALVADLTSALVNQGHKKTEARRRAVKAAAAHNNFADAFRSAVQ